MAHQIADVEVEEEEYDENADEDFAPDATQADEVASSSSEDDTPVAKTQKGKKRKSAVVAEGELDSGDEATIQERKKKRRKGAAQQENEESGGEGGLIKTRAQRLAEKVERKQRSRATVGEVTIDVEKLWADMQSLPVGKMDLVVPVEDDDMDVDGEQDEENLPVEPFKGEEMITIKRNIEYAGEVTEVEEQVLRSSKEAQRYLAEHPEADPDYKPLGDSGVQRPLKRPSMFEPNPTAAVKGVPPDRLRPRAPSRLDVLMAEKRAEEEQAKKAEKMTTVQKSALDWRGFVDQQGLREELDEYGKSKKGFLAREDFLDRAQFARDVKAREARLKG